jgi:DNA-binding HxlR family transcriptional regulator
MAKKPALREDSCPVARALYIMGDRWSLLIIRDAFDGSRRFGEFRQSLGVAKNILAERLKLLVEEGILALVPASDGSSYLEYVLTQKGQDLFPIIMAFRQWGESHMYGKGEKHSVLVERSTGKVVPRIELRNAAGGLLKPADAFVKKLLREPGLVRARAPRGKA